MTSISPRSTSGPITDDPSWIGSEHGIATNKTVTLDLSAFTEATHFPNGFVPSGTPLGLITASGLYGPYDDGAADGTETLDCFLYAPIEVLAADDTPTGAGFQLGPVIEANLPIAIDAAAKADVAGKIWFE